MSEQAALDRVAGLIRRESGLELPPNRQAALRAAIRRTGAAGPDEFLALIARSGSRAAVERLLDEVTVQETSFYRDVGQLAAIDWHGLYTAAVRAAAALVRVWSAGCATGEEVYTLAMLASEAFAPGPPPVEIVGTDISGAALGRALEGRYGPRRVHTVPLGLQDRYFEVDGGALVVRPALRSLVRFARHNLVGDAAPPAGEAPFDLVVCRNVLIYFDPQTAERVADSLAGALRAGGTLLLGAADQLGRAQRLGRDEATGSRHPGTSVRARPEDLLADAQAAADAGNTAEALARIGLLRAHDPLNAGGHFLRGLIELPHDPRAAVDSLRRALLIDPRFSVAAFQLGRAYDALGDEPAARAAYVQALHTLDSDDLRYDQLLGQIDLGDVATAVRARISALT